MTMEFVFAGFGGQGVLTAGMVLAYAGAEKDLDVTWIPSYGAEMRGGTANCTVKLSQEEVASPFPKRLDVLVAMNEPSLVKFAPSVKPGGHIVANSSVIRNIPEVPGVEVHAVAVNDIAAAAGNPRSANLCALGAAVACAGGMITLEEVENGMRGYFTKIKDHSGNLEIMRSGYRAVKP